jgi:hypothetical protein
LQTWPASAVNLVDDGTKESFDEVFKYDTFRSVNPKLEDPMPLSNEWFLASGMTGQGERMGIYLLGRDGTMQLVHDDKEVLGCFDSKNPCTKPYFITSMFSRSYGLTNL